MVDRNNIILIGAGGHCRSCIDVIEQENKFRIAGVVDNSPEVSPEGIFMPGSDVHYPLLGSDEDLAVLRKDYTYALVAVGQIKSPSARINLFDRLLELEFKLPVIVSPWAYVSIHAHIGSGSIIMHHAVVNAFAEVGRNCIVNTKGLIEHDVCVEDHCHIAPGAVLAGGVHVGRGTFFGCNAMSKEYVTIGPESVIGGGQSVLADLPEKSRPHGITATSGPAGKG